MSIRWHLLWVSALLLGCAVGSGEAETVSSGPDRLHFELLAKPSYTAGDPVVVGFRLHGRAGATLFVLRWHTPLEGLRARVFRVRRGATEIPYAGPTIKRGDPAREDYLELPAGGVLSAEVDLATVYDFSVPGEYLIEFTGALLDAAPAGAALPRKRERFTQLALEGKPATLRVVAKR